MDWNMQMVRSLEDYYLEPQDDEERDDEDDDF